MISGLARAGKLWPPRQVSLAGGTSTSTAWGVGTPGAGYSTQFAGTESPLSEGGVWTNGGTTGLDWTDVRKTPNLAFATSASGYRDSIACLSGYPARMSSRGIIHMGVVGAGETHEIELLHRFVITPHNARGYETLLNNGGNIQFVRWNGAVNDFTVLSGGANVSIKDGDEFRVDIIGNVISVYLNGAFVTTADVTRNGGTVWSDGSPGIGFDKSAAGSYDAFGLKSFSTYPV